MNFSFNRKNLKYSILYDDGLTSKDSLRPFSLTEFKQFYIITTYDADILADQYDAYISDWNIEKNKSIAESIKQNKIDNYKSFLKSIDLNYTTDDERRILSNLDYDDELELDVAVSFYIKKLTQVIQDNTNDRYKILNSKKRWELKGNLIFLKKLIREYIIENYINKLSQNEYYNRTYQNLSSFNNNFNLDIKKWYKATDNYQTNYFDFSNTSIFLSSDGDYVLSSFDLSSFSDYTRDSELNQTVKSKLFKKWSSVNRIIGGNDIETTTDLYDYNNLYSVGIALSSDNSDLLSIDDIGYYFTNKFTAYVNYYSLSGISLSSVGGISYDGKYFGENILDFNKDYKGSNNNQGIKDKPKINGFKRFYGYKSRNEVIGDSFDLENYTDNIEIWSGEFNNVWDNSDIFKKYDNLKLNRDEKNNSFFLLSDTESVTKSCDDIFGNNYILVKERTQLSGSSSEVYNTLQTEGDLTLIGQFASVALSAIQVDTNNAALGYYDIEDGSATLNSINSYSVDEKVYVDYALSAYNTNIITLDQYNVNKTVYDYELAHGSVYLRDIQHSFIKNLSSFFFADSSDIRTELSGVSNIDIINDVMFIETDTKFLIRKVLYNYSNSNYSILKLLNGRYYNNPLHKSLKYWNKKNNLYYGNLSSNSQTIELSLQRYDHEKYLNSAINLDINSFVISSGVTALSVENISRPNVIVTDNSIFVNSLLKDIYDNYFFHIINYNYNEDINHASYNYDYFYTPEKIKLNYNLSSDPVSAYLDAIDYTDALSALNGGLRVYKNLGDNSIETLVSPAYTTTTVAYYDNDLKTTTNKDLINKKYNLSSYSSLAPVSVVDTGIQSIYSYDIGNIYAPSSLTVDYKSLSGFGDIIPPTTNIVKIIYTYNDNIISKNVIQSSQAGDIYNSNFINSPINLDAEVFELESNAKSTSNSITVDLYDTARNITTFEILFNTYTIDNNDLYGKWELLDSRLNSSNNEMIMYINTKEPNSLIGINLKLNS